ncbi:universal stress protein [Caballeronia grimmiae]|uniref:universal stress protein n=1 Tax=Caballeronia grimmiae TaxID=1071679 RepID=UPI0038BDC64D
MYRNIVVAFDGSASSLRALDEAIRVAQGVQAIVHVVFVADVAALSSYPYIIARKFSPMHVTCLTMHACVCVTLEWAARQPFSKRKTQPTRSRDAFSGTPRKCAPTVMMGTHGRTGLKPLVLGSVAEAFCGTRCVRCSWSARRLECWNACMYVRLAESASRVRPT